MHLFIDGRGRHARAARERRRDSEVREEKGRAMFYFSFEAPHGLPTRPRVLTLESLHADYFKGRKQSGISLNLRTGPTGHATLFNQ